MKQVVRLVNIQFLAVFRNLIVMNTNKKKNNTTLYLGLLLFTFGLGSVSFIYSYAMGSSLKLVGALDALPGLFMAITCLLVFITTMFKVKGTVFAFKDYDLVMSLPISTKSVVISRIILLYVTNMLFVFIAMVPMMIVYGILAEAGVSFYILSIINLFIIPLIPIIIATFFGTVITFLASKFKHNNLVSIVISFAALVSIMLLSSSVRGTTVEFGKFGKAVMERVNRIYPLASLYIKSVCNAELIPFLIFIGISVAIFLIYILIIGKLFKKLNSNIMSVRTQSNYKMHKLKQNSLWKALYLKEVGRYFSSPIYVLNSGFGTVMATLGVIALAFVDPHKYITDPAAYDMMRPFVSVILCFCSIMGCTTMSSISLEGKNLWIIKSVPVAPKQIYLAKIALNLTISAPIVLDGALICFFLKTDPVVSLFVVLIPLLSSIFVAVFGLLMNLKFPNFNWVTEAAVVKQGAATLIVTFSAFLIVAALAALIYVMPAAWIGLLLDAVLLAAASVILYRVLMTWGVQRFQEL